MHLNAQPTNHLDVTTIKVISEALKSFEGTVIVISHDKGFLTDFEPTHVLSVRSGKALLEERGLVESDWRDELNAKTENSKFVDSDIAPESVAGKNQKNGGTKKSKKESSAPAATLPIETVSNKMDNAQHRKLSKLESSISKYEKEIARIDEEMFANGRNRAKLTELQAEKDKRTAKVGSLYAELEGLM